MTGKLLPKKVTAPDITYFLAKGALSPKTLMSVMTDLGFDRQDVADILRQGLDRGVWHLDSEMDIKLGSLYDN